MATIAQGRPSFLARTAEGMKQLPAFLREVRQEMRKVTWPDRAQLKSATIAIIVFVLVVGTVIFLMDYVLQLILVRGIPSIFGA